MTIHKSIDSYHLIMFPFCENNYWYTFMFIWLDKNKFILIQFDSLNNEARNDESRDLIKWFKSSLDVKKHKLTISTYYPIKYSNQNHTYSFGPFVCIHAFNASVLSSTSYTKVKWIIQFRDVMENQLNPNYWIHDFRNDLLDFCLSIKRDSIKIISKDNITLSSSSHYNK